MQLNQHQEIGDPNDLIQLVLWPDDEILEVLHPAQDPEQDAQENASHLVEGKSSATQLYLPGFEPE